MARRDSEYCEHGTYVGTPLGPDYMCGYCESGVTMEEFAAARRAQYLAWLRQRVVRWYPDILWTDESVKSFMGGQYNARFATFMWDMFEMHADEIMAAVQVLKEMGVEVG